MIKTLKTRFYGMFEKHKNVKTQKFTLRFGHLIFIELTLDVM